MNKVRVAIIGTGMIANSAHIPSIKILEKEGLAEIVAVADIREEDGNATVAKIKEAETYNETLIATKDNLDSKEYIEKICREKLDMYSENEKVYININK